MPGLSHNQVVAIGSALCFGLPPGLCLTTKTEALKKGMTLPADPIDPFERVGVPEFAKIVAVALCKLILVGTTMLVLGIGVLRLGGLDRPPPTFRRGTVIAILERDFLRLILGKGFRRGRSSDSRCMLVLEASMHGSSVLT